VAIPDHVFSPGIKADSWSWKISTGLESWIAYTQPCTGCVNNVSLIRWHVEAVGEKFNIDFASDFKVD
jgi:hypothetical protein